MGISQSDSSGSDDKTIKGIVDKNTPDTSNGLTYTEGDVNRRALDVNVINPNDISGGNASVSCYSPKFRYDFDSSVVALSNSFVDQYSYTGTGKLIGFRLEFSSKDVEVNLLVDSEVLFTVSADDMATHGNSNIEENMGIMWEPNKKTVSFYPRFPICFGTDVKIQSKKITGNVNRTHYVVSIEKVS